MSVNWPACPASLKGIQSTLKIALEHDDRDLVVAYWARVYALQVGLKQSTRQENEMQLLVAIMDWLEMFKRNHGDNEAITNEVVAQAHLENYALKLFLYADKQDRSSNWNKNVVKAFFSSAVIYDILQTFGELTEEVSHNRKYAKWKASYIHNCLKNGMTPVPGPMDDEQAADEDEHGHNVDNSGLDEFQASPTDTNIKPVTPTSPPAGVPFMPQPNFNEEPKDDNLPSTSRSTLPDLPSATVPNPTATVTSQKKPSSENIMQAQKYCKYAISSLNYDDIKAAVENLENALAALSMND